MLCPNPSFHQILESSRQLYQFFAAGVLARLWQHVALLAAEVKAALQIFVAYLSISLVPFLLA